MSTWGISPLPKSSPWKPCAWACGEIPFIYSWIKRPRDEEVRADRLSADALFFTAFFYGEIFTRRDTGLLVYRLVVAGDHRISTVADRSGTLWVQRDDPL